METSRVCRANAHRAAGELVELGMWTVWGEKEPHGLLQHALDLATLYLRGAKVVGTCAREERRMASSGIVALRRREIRVLLAQRARQGLLLGDPVTSPSPSVISHQSSVVSHQSSVISHQ